MEGGGLWCTRSLDQAGWYKVEAPPELDLKKSERGCLMERGGHFTVLHLIGNAQGSFA
jgi:hypothetical protein